MQEKNYKIFIFPLVAIVLFASLLFAAGYAYFNSSLTMATSNYQIDLPKTTSLICTKTDCSTTITPAMMANTNTNATTAKATSTCYVNCTCSGTQGAVCNYNLSLISAGDPYRPSATLGTNTEFSVNVTSPTGCTAQNKSGNAKSVNKLSDKVVSSCSLTVPAGGSVSANVSVKFKWYNLDLDQTVHASKEYKYYLSNEYLLPDEYQQVEYIVFGGPQTYFDTGFVPNQDTRLETDIYTYNSIGTAFWFGARQSSTTTATTNGILYLRLSGDGERYGYGSNDYYITGVTTLPLRRHIYYDKNKLYVDNQLVQTWTYTSYTAPCSLAIGNVFSTSSKTTYNNGSNTNARIYYFKLWNGDTLERFYIPVKRISDNVPGMYDLVHGTFKTNEGTGTLGLPS